MSSSGLPYSVKDVHYDNAKFRNRSLAQIVNQTFVTSDLRRTCTTCSIGKLLALLLTVGLTIMILTPKTPLPHTNPHGRLPRKSRIPTKRTHSPDEIHNATASVLRSDKLPLSSEWKERQEKVKQAFVHAWSGYKKHAMGYDELMPLSQKGVDGLGGLGATIIDSLDTAMLMGLDDIVSEAGSWIETNLLERISQKGQVNFFETTIRILGGLLSAYHLSDGEVVSTTKGPKPQVYLQIAKELADHLMTAFTSSPTSIPYSDVVLKDHSAHPAPDGLSSTSEVSTVQLEFNYLSQISGEPKYAIEAMKVLEHFKALPKVEGLVPIYISPVSGQFVGENIRLGSRGDSYYEYLLKVWLQQKENRTTDLKYLHDMYEEAMKGVKHLLVRKSIPSGLTFVGELPYGSHGIFSPKMDHLVCFLPGTLALGATRGLTKQVALEKKLLNGEELENLNLAEDLAKTCFEIYSVTSTGLAPEIAYFHIQIFSLNSGNSDKDFDGGNKNSEYINDIIIKPADRHNLLRPETVESLFILHRITQDVKYRDWGWKIFEAFENHTKVNSGGYCSLDDVTTIPPHKRDKMETFFLGETLKYLFLLFGEENILPLDKFVFNTEAHPLPIR